MTFNLYEILLFVFLNCILKEKLDYFINNQNANILQTDRITVKAWDNALLVTNLDYYFFFK